MLCRSRQNYIAETWTYNNGKSWTPVKATQLPNPNAGIDALTLADGEQLLVYNPTVAGKDWWNGRNKLVMARSADGVHWQQVLVLEDKKEGEYSYPAIITDSRNIIRIAYTGNRQNIKFADIRY